MKRTLRFFYLLAMMLVMSISANAAITKQGGWFEAAYAEWAAVSGATDYNVYVKQSGGSYTQLDKQLVRKYPSYFRADAVGLAAGTYQMKVVPVIGGAEDASKAMETSALTVVAHDRNGFAHVGQSGVGAYKNDGTLKADARVLYVTANNAKTVSLDMQVDAKGKIETRTGLQDIIQAYEKGQEKRPLAVRIVGTVKAADMDAFGSSAEGLQVKGNGSKTAIANLTIEGIGEDAAIHSFGILCRGISNVEFRNFAIMNCMDDCLSLDTDNKNIWIHNMDFFYGAAGGAADQAKGDGTVDIKGLSSHVTVSYNHFFDSGKCSLGGMKSESTDCWMTYHHNWFDHSDSRHPRIRTAFYHCYNNYYDGNAKYGVGVTSGGSAFVEANYFRNCKYPMLISKQGTDAQGDGTFSGEAGGVIKAYNNLIMNPKQVLYYDGKQTDGVWDAVKANSRDENITATAFSGGTSYNNAATTAAISAVPASAINDPQDIPTIVRGALGAGRMNHGDVDWKFNNAIEDANYGVIAELKTAIVKYQSTLVGFADGETINNGGANGPLVGGNGQGISQEQNDAVVPEWGAGGDAPEETDFEEEPFIASADDDMFWVGENAAQTNAYIADGTITLADGAAIDGAAQKSSFNTTYAGNDTYVAEHIGSLQLGKAATAKSYTGGSAVFYCPNGVTSFKINVLRTGTIHFKVLKSTDGNNYTEVGKVEDQKAGIATKDFSAAVRNTESKDPVWIKVVNGSTGGLNIHGVYICQLPSDAVTLETSDLAVSVTEKSLNIGEQFKVAYTTSSTGAVSYSSNNNNVATVDAEGNVTAMGEGTCNIIVNQMKDETYKAGSATIKLTVTDPRAESQFAVTSSATVSLKEGETSQIAISGAAGAVTYASSKAAVATVSNTGLITAVGAGSATITITDAGNDNVKGTSKTVNVTVTKDMTGKTLVTFKYDGKAVDASDASLVGLASANGKSGLSVSYNGQTLTDGAKMESATLIKITPSADAKVTLIFDLGSKKLKIDEVSCTTDANGQYTFNATGGKTYALTKGDSMNLVGVLFDFGNGGTTGGGDEGGETGGGDEGGETGNTDTSAATAIDYPTSKAGVNIKGTTAEVDAGLKLNNSYSSKASDGTVTYGNGILLKVDGGFKAGDVITINGTITVTEPAEGATQTDIENYNKKIATTVSLVTVDPTDASKTTLVNKFNPLANTKVTSESADQSFTLTEDCAELWLVRDGGTAVTVTKITSGSEQGGGEENNGLLINYQHTATVTGGITLSGTTAMGSANIHSNKDAANGIKFANGYTTGGLVNDNYIKLHVEGERFKKGDVVTVSGFFNNSDDTKLSGVDIFVIKDDGTPNVLWTSEKFTNGRLASTDPVEQTYTLEFDTDYLYIGRNGNTATLIYTLTVTRPESKEDDLATGIESIISTVNGAIYDLQGRRIAQPVKGQMYIMGGKKFIQK